MDVAFPSTLAFAFAFALSLILARGEIRDEGLETPGSDMTS